MSILKDSASSFLKRVRRISTQARHEEAKKITEELDALGEEIPDNLKMIYHEELHSFILMEEFGDKTRPMPLAFAPCHAKMQDYHNDDARIEDLFDWTVSRIREHEYREHEKKMKLTKDARCEWLFRMLVRLREMTLEEMLTSEDDEARLLGTIIAGAQLKEL